MCFFFSDIQVRLFESLTGRIGSGPVHSIYFSSSLLFTENSIPTGRDHSENDEEYRDHAVTASLHRSTHRLPRYLFSRFISVDLPSSEEIEIHLLKDNFCFCFSFMSALILLHQEINSVRGFPAVVICIIFSFAWEFSALVLRNKPDLTILRRCYFFLSIASMASALSILLVALFLESFRRFYRGLNCNKLNMNIFPFQIWFKIWGKNKIKLSGKISLKVSWICIWYWYVMEKRLLFSFSYLIKF